MLARSFTHQQDLRILGTVAKDHIGAGLGQGAALAAQAILPQCFPLIHRRTSFHEA